MPVNVDPIRWGAAVRNEQQIFAETWINLQVIIYACWNKPGQKRYMLCGSIRTNRCRGNGKYTPVRRQEVERGSITKAVSKPARTADTLSVWCRDGLTVGSKWYTVCFISVCFIDTNHTSVKSWENRMAAFVLEIPVKRKNTSSGEFTEISGENPLRMDNLESL